jgi:hypothetical protein
MPKQQIGRYAGFPLYDDEIGIAINDWLDSAHDINVSDVIRRQMYMVATGQVYIDPAMAILIDRFDQLEQQITALRGEVRTLAASGLRAPASQAAPLDDAADIERRLGSLPD